MVRTSGRRNQGGCLLNGRAVLLEQWGEQNKLRLLLWGLGQNVKASLRQLQSTKCQGTRSLAITQSLGESDSKPCHSRGPACTSWTQSLARLPRIWFISTKKRMSGENSLIEVVFLGAGFECITSSCGSYLGTHARLKHTCPDDPQGLAFFLFWSKSGLQPVLG